jgi:3-oxoacyl-[acyl-carrier-protein] synthase II
MSNKKRIVITGIGALSPVGNNAKSSWNALIQGRTGIGKITHFDSSLFSSKIAGELKNFDDSLIIEEKESKRMDLFMRYGVVAAFEAVEDSGWMPKDEFARSRTGVLIGSGIGGLKAIEDNAIKIHQGEKVSPFFIPSCLINLASGYVSIKYGFTGPNHSVVTACATGAHAIGDAAKIIERGDADVMVAGGCEAAICMSGVAGFAALRALSTKYNDSPEIASRPFDKNRDGFVIGEGAGIIVLEEYEHAKSRGAKIYAEIAGYGMGGDAYNIVAPHPEGVGAIAAMNAALKDASISINDVEYINAHATSTPVGDILELKSIQKLFSTSSNRLFMSSTKGATGYLLGGAGSLEIIFTALAIKNGILPPTINLENPEETDINLVPNSAIQKDIKIAMSNSFGFGGTNASVILKKL